MDRARRGDLVDRCYVAVDRDEYGEFDAPLAESASHVRPGRGSIGGPAAIERHFDADAERHARYRIFRGYQR